jgi:hypothetical protein
MLQNEQVITKVRGIRVRIGMDRDNESTEVRGFRKARVHGSCYTRSTHDMYGKLHNRLHNINLQLLDVEDVDLLCIINFFILWKVCL